jgi:transcriptional regulator of nitric oxide reductase
VRVCACACARVRVRGCMRARARACVCVYITVVGLSPVKEKDTLYQLARGKETCGWKSCVTDGSVERISLTAAQLSHKI